MLQFVFFDFFIGKALTENLGLALGALGFALLWRGARLSQMRQSLGGLFVLTLALNARAGAFFVLPMILLWGAYHYRQRKRFSLRFLFFGVGAILAGVLANLLLLQLIGANLDSAFSNYSTVLYGLAAGNKGWQQVYRDYPGVGDNEIWGLAIKQILSTPGLFLSGIAGAVADYFSPSSL